MSRAFRSHAVLVGLTLLCAVPLLAQRKIGSEQAIQQHLRRDEELKIDPLKLVEFGRKLFEANWTVQDGAGRPMSKGTGRSLSDSTHLLKGLQTFNRISGPDANSCAGCHRSPFNTPGGSGDIVTNVFEGAERFDYLTFDRHDVKPTRGSVDERVQPVNLNTSGNIRLPPDLLGAGYLEMLARQITQDLQRIRDSVLPGQSKALVSKGISFGTLKRLRSGAWDLRSVEGLAAQSLVVTAPSVGPSLVIRPWRQSGSWVSLRDMTNYSYNQHLGIQTTERFGVGTDPDGDGVINEMTRGDVTAAVLFEATLQVPGRVIPNDPSIERAVLKGEQTFEQLGCTTCHISRLPLDKKGWMYTEPGPNNPPGNARREQTRPVVVDLTNQSLPQPRLVPSIDTPDVIAVPAYTDVKLHDITDPADPAAMEPLDLNQPAGSPKYFAGNRKFLTRRLWGVGNQPPYWHDGRFTTLKEAVIAHAGEALASRHAFEHLAKADQEAMIAFLSSLQALPAGTSSTMVDERLQPRRWPPDLSRSSTTQR